MLGDAGRFGVTGQIISSLKHRDKARNDASIDSARLARDHARAQPLGHAPTVA
jgi:hypothetical protein